MVEIAARWLEWLADLGPIGLFLGLAVEVIPSELVLAFGGYLIAEGRMTWAAAMAAGIFGGILSQWMIYAAARYGGRPFLERYGKWILLSPKKMEMAEGWFRSYGGGMVFTARFIPIVRHAISIPAGLARMPQGLFLLYTGLAIVPWTWFFLWLGTVLEDNWTQIKMVVEPYVWPMILFSFILTLGYLAYRRLQRSQWA